MASIASHELEFCTECGEFVERLDEYSGWCDSCSVKSGAIAPSCPSCKEPTAAGKLCSRCKYNSWLLPNADAIEVVMATEIVSARVAKRIVQASNRPICNSCRQPIKGGQKGRHFFCTKNPECIKAHYAYAYHIRIKPHNEALSLAVTASVIYKLTANIYSNR